MKTYTIRLLLALSLLLLLTGIAVAQDDDAVVVKIGGIHPLTGGLAGDGIQMDNAIQMAIDEINESDMLEGFVLEYVGADSTGSAETGQTEAERLVGEEGVAAIICCFQSAVTANVATIAVREGVPLVIDVAAATNITEIGRTEDGEQWVFRIQPNAKAMGQYGAQFLREIAEAYGVEINTVAYLHEGVTDYGLSVYTAFEEAAGEYDIEVAEAIGYEFGADYTTEVTLANALGVDAVLVTGYYGDGLTIAQNMEDVALDVPLVYGVAQGTYDQEQFVADAGDLAECFFDSNYHWDASNEEALEVRERFEEEFEEPMRSAAILSYQATYVIADAIARAESGDPADIQAALLETEYEDHILPNPGPIMFEDGENVNAVPVVMQVQDGAVVQVWPEDVAEAEPRICTSWGG